MRFVIYIPMVTDIYSQRRVVFLPANEQCGLPCSYCVLCLDLIISLHPAERRWYGEVADWVSYGNFNSGSYPNSLADILSGQLTDCVSACRIGYVKLHYLGFSETSCFTYPP